MRKGFTLCTSVNVPEEFVAASWSKCSSTCSCREKLSRQTNEHMGQSKPFSPRTQRGNQTQCHMQDRNTEVADLCKTGWKKLNWENRGRRYRCRSLDVGLTTSNRTAGAGCANRQKGRYIQHCISENCFSSLWFSFYDWLATTLCGDDSTSDCHE